MNYWQVAAGDGGRDYSAVFLKYGVMLIGPGDAGDYFKNKDFYSEKGINDVATFAEQVKEGDAVILKRPSGMLWEVIAVGIIKSHYDYLSVFDDVEGWNLQHCRYVSWKVPRKRKVISGLTRGTFKGVRKKIPIETLNNELTIGKRRKARQIPKPSGKLDDEELIDILINHGLRPKDSEDFASTINRIRRLVKWYIKSNNLISEHETRTFLIVPLLLALGWSEQKLKIEWRNIDIAFFENPYTKLTHREDCVTILESKRLWEGLDVAVVQAERYANQYPNCYRLIISDGCCYKLYVRRRKVWKYAAYLNILKPKISHSYNNKVGGASDVFTSLMGK